MRASAFAALLITAAILATACGKSETATAPAPDVTKSTAAAAGPEPTLPNAPPEPKPDIIRKLAAVSEAASDKTGDLTVEPQKAKSDNMPPGAIISGSAGLSIYATLAPGAATEGATPPDWSKLLGGPVKTDDIVVYTVDAETLPGEVKGEAGDGLCAPARLFILAIAPVGPPAAKRVKVAAFKGDVWPPADAKKALCGVYEYTTGKAPPRAD